MNWKSKKQPLSISGTNCERFLRHFATPVPGIGRRQKHGKRSQITDKQLYMCVERGNRELYISLSLSGYCLKLALNGFEKWPNHAPVWLNIHSTRDLGLLKLSFNWQYTTEGPTLISNSSNRAPGRSGKTGSLSIASVRKCTHIELLWELASKSQVSLSLVWKMWNRTKRNRDHLGIERQEEHTTRSPETFFQTVAC